MKKRVRTRSVGTRQFPNISETSAVQGTDSSPGVISASSLKAAILAHAPGGSGSSDHGALTGLGDDDHSQYHNDTRGDARYYTQSAVDSALSGKSSTSHAHAWGDITGTIADQTDLQTALDNARPWTYVILGSTFENSTTSNSAVTGLSFTPLANTRYEIEGRFILQAAATTTGPRPGIDWPNAGVSQNAAWIVAPKSATAFASRFFGNTNTANAASTGTAVVNEGIYSQMQAIMVTDGSISGDFQITLASEIASSASRMMVNSFIRYRTY